MVFWQRYSQLDLNEERFTRPMIIVLLLVSLAITIYVNYPFLKDRWVINNDLRTTTYWMPKFQDPELFNDYVSKRMIRNSYKYSLGYVLLYYMASFIVEPSLFSKVLPLILVPLTVYFFFKVGRLIAGNVTGIFTSFFAIPFLQYYTFAGGITRAFCWPLLAAFVYFLLSKQYRKVSLILILEALFYAAILPLCGLTYLLSFLCIEWKGRKVKLRLTFSKDKLIWGGLGTIVIVLILFQTIVGQLTIDKETLDMSSYGPGGRHPTFSNKQLYYGSIIGKRIKKLGMYKIPEQYIFGRGGLVGEKKKDGNKVGPLVFILLLSLFWSGTQVLHRLDKELWGLFLLSLILFVVAWNFLPRLYFPIKHTFGMLVFLIVAGAASLAQLMRTTASLSLKGIVTRGFSLFALILFFPSFLCNYGVILWTMAGGCLAILILPLIFRKVTTTQAWYNLRFVVVAIGIGFWLSMFSKVTGLVDPTPQQRELYGFVSTLPKSSLIAGYPRDENLDNIAFYSKRGVFMSQEFFGSLTANGLDKEIEERISAVWDAYYAESWDTVVKFCREYGVTHLLVDKKYLDKVHPCYQPINSKMAHLKERSNFVLVQIPDSLFLFKEGSVGIIDSRDLARIAGIKKNKI
jgi:hypothetical protein